MMLASTRTDIPQRHAGAAANRLRHLIGGTNA